MGQPSLPDFPGAYYVSVPFQMQVNAIDIQWMSHGRQMQNNESHINGLSTVVVITHRGTACMGPRDLS